MRCREEGARQHRSNLLDFPMGQEVTCGIDSSPSSASPVRSPVVPLLEPSVFAQARGTAKPSAVPRTPDGRPDLQGNWSFATITPFERPANLGDKAVLTDQEAAEFEKQTAARAKQDEGRQRGTAADVEPRLQRFLVRPRHARRRHATDLDRRRSAERPRAGDDGRRPGARGRARPRRAASGVRPTAPKIARSPNAASSGSTPGRRSRRARTTTTSRSCRRATT